MSLRIKHIATAGGLLLAACAQAPDDPAMKLASAQEWAQAFAPRAKAAVDKVNAKLHITPEDVKWLCGAANVAHTTFTIAALVAPLPSGAAEIEQGAHAVTAATCALAEQGTLPTQDQAQQIAATLQQTNAAVAKLTGK